MLTAHFSGLPERSTVSLACFPRLRKSLGSIRVLIIMIYLLRGITDPFLRLDRNLAILCSLPVSLAQLSWW